jgi:hypothetical protein
MVAFTVIMQHVLPDCVLVYTSTLRKSVAARHSQ